jgi:RimJ/RimL family protein N-acetyltransferase
VPYPTPDGVLSGEIVTLRPWAVEDAEWYVLARDEEIFRWTSEPHELEPAQVVEAILKNQREPAFASFAITDALTSELMGNIGIGPKAGSDAEVSYWLAASARGRGAATEAVKLVASWALGVGFETLQLRTRAGNHASQAVALRAGFQLVEKSENECRFEFTFLSTS